MTDLDQLDSIIQDLETTSKGLKSIRSVYADLMEMGQSIEDISGKMQSANTTLQGIASDLRDENLRISTLCARISEESLKLIEKNHSELTIMLGNNETQLVSRLERFQSDSIVEIRRGSEHIEKTLEVSLERSIQRIEDRYQEGIVRTSALVKKTAVGILSAILVLVGLVIALIIMLKS